MPGLLGKKIGMTSVFGADGKNIPCTVIEAGPCVVTQLKTIEKDGYKAAQVGFMHKNEKHTNKAEAGHFKAAGVEPMRHFTSIWTVKSKSMTPLRPASTKKTFSVVIPIFKSWTSIRRSPSSDSINRSTKSPRYAPPSPRPKTR